MEFIQWKVWSHDKNASVETMKEEAKTNPPTYYVAFRFSEDEKTTYKLDERFENVPTVREAKGVGLRRNERGLVFSSDNLDEVLNTSMDIFRSFLTISNNIE